MDVEVEQWPRFAPGLVDYKVVEGIMLIISSVGAVIHRHTYMWNDEIFLPSSALSQGLAHLYVHQVFIGCAAQFRELGTALAKECADIIPFLALARISNETRISGCTHLYGSTVAASVPVRIHDFDLFIPDSLLFFEPSLPQIFSLQTVLLVALFVRQERSVNSGVFSDSDFRPCFATSAGRHQSACKALPRSCCDSPPSGSSSRKDSFDLSLRLIFFLAGPSPLLVVSNVLFYHLPVRLFGLSS